MKDIGIVKIPYKKYVTKIEHVRQLVSHINDLPYIASALLLNCPIWSGNSRHFNHLENFDEIIWFNSRRLLDFLEKKEMFKNK